MKGDGRLAFGVEVDALLRPVVKTPGGYVGSEESGGEGATRRRGAGRFRGRGRRRVRGRWARVGFGVVWLRLVIQGGLQALRFQRLER